MGFCFLAPIHPQHSNFYLENYVLHAVCNLKMSCPSATEATGFFYKKLSPLGTAKHLHACIRSLLVVSDSLRPSGL